MINTTERKVKYNQSDSLKNDDQPAAFDQQRQQAVDIDYGTGAAPENPEPLPTGRLPGEDSEEQFEYIPKKDFSTFVSNNWLKDDNENAKLAELDHKGGAIWLDGYGKPVFRNSPNDKPKTLDKLTAEVAIANKIDCQRIKLFRGESPDIYPNDLRSAPDLFTPFSDKEFYQVDSRTYRTSWKPTPFLIGNKAKSIPPGTIFKLLFHLCNQNQSHFDWFLNWLAGFRQTLRKSQVAIVLRGDQGAGKGILCNEILSPIFGEDYCVTIDDDRLGSNFKDWISGKLFYFLNEISKDQKSRKNVKNFLKQLVTDRQLHSERKYHDAELTEVFGNVIITSNETYVLEVEPNDRRYSVFLTSGNLRKAGWNIPDTLWKIKEELHGFSDYLNDYSVDWQAYHTALHTPEKEALVAGTTDRFSYFVSKLKDRSPGYFEVVALEAGKDKVDAHRILTETADAYQNGFDVNHIASLFSLMTDDEQISNRKLMTRLRAVDPITFENRDATKDSGGNYKANGRYFYRI